MPKPETVTPQSPKKGLRHKKLYTTLALILGIPFLILGTMEFAYQQNIAAMRGAIEEVKNEVAIPAGGVEKSAPSVTHGPHFYDKLTCFDTNCPQMESTWLVPLAANDVARFKSNVESKIDTREKWHVDVFADSTNEAPYAAPTGKEWRSIHIFVYE